jgi:hypothetical protein
MKKLIIIPLLIASFSSNAESYKWDLIFKNKSNKNLVINSFSIKYTVGPDLSFSQRRSLKKGEQLVVHVEDGRKKQLRRIVATIPCKNDAGGVTSKIAWPRKNSPNASNINKKYFKRNYAASKGNTIPVWFINQDCKNN